MKKENIKYIILFLFFTVLLFLSPISGDDWGNYLEGSQGIRHIFGNAIGMYFDWEGRFVSRILINFLTYYKPLWNIVNSLAIVGIIYLIIKIINPKNQNLIFFLSTLAIFLMNIFTFSQVVVWLAGNITYLFVIPLMLYYFYTLLNKKKHNIIFFAILNIIMPMFVEHMGVILVAGNILLLLKNFIEEKKIDKILLLYLICSIIGLLAMILSPGSMKRNETENPSFKQLSIFEKIVYNLPNFIYYTYFIYPYLSILMTIGTYYLLKTQIKNKTFKIIGYTYLLPLPIIISLLYLITSITQQELLKVFNHNNIFIILYFVSYIIIQLILICQYTKTRKDDKALFFFMLGISANLVMLISPTWGYRTSFGTYIFLIITYLIIIDKNIKEKKYINYLLFTITIICMCFYTIFYISIYKQNKENEKRIEEQKNNTSKTIEIIRYPSYANCNINPDNEYHMMKFKDYYGINQDIEIKLINNNWKYYIFYKKVSS